MMADTLTDMLDSMETIAGISMVGGGAAAKLDEARTIARHAVRRAKARQPTHSLANFLQAWANQPIPYHILDAGTEIMELDEYTPEKRVHQIVVKCVTLWAEGEGL